MQFLLLLNFASFRVLVYESEHCQCLKIEVFGTGHKLLWVLHWLDGELSHFIHCVSTSSESMSCVTSLTADGLRESSMLLNGFISPRCKFLGRTMSSELEFITVHSRHTVNFLEKNFNYWHNRDFAVSCTGLMVPWSYNGSQVLVYY